MIPRRVNRQNHRENYPIIDVESYFFQSFYVPYAEHLSVQMFEDQRMIYQIIEV